MKPAASGWQEHDKTSDFYKHWPNATSYLLIICSIFYGSFGFTATFFKKRKFLNWSFIALQCVIVALNVAV